MTPSRTPLVRASTGSAARFLNGLFCGQDGSSDLDQLEVLVAGQPLQAAKVVLLIQCGSLHQDALGTLDYLAILEGLPEIGGLLAQRFKLLETPQRQSDDGFQI